VTSKSALENPRKNERRIGAESLKKIVSSGAFYTKQFTPEGTDFFYFHDYGDFLKGQLLGKRSNAHICRGASYRIKVEAMRRDGAHVEVEEGQIEEFMGNKILQRLIDKNELIGSTVRIVFIGKQKTAFGHSAKIYDVFKITGVQKESESRQDGSKRKYKQRTWTKPKQSGAARIRAAEGRNR